MEMRAPTQPAPAPQREVAPRAAPPLESKRKGPMESMRTLMRMLKCLIRDARRAYDDSGGRGPGMGEQQVKRFMDRVLGEAPRPEWGCPQGHAAYLAQLFTWASSDAATPEGVVTPEQAARCVRRQCGRRYEAVEAELGRIGLRPARWRVPLCRAQVVAANVGDDASSCDDASSGAEALEMLRRGAATPSAAERWCAAVELARAAAAVAPVDERERAEVARHQDALRGVLEGGRLRS